MAEALGGQIIQQNGYISWTKGPKICIEYYFPLINYPKKKTASGIIKKGAEAFESDVQAARKPVEMLIKKMNNNWKYEQTTATDNDKFIIKGKTKSLQEKLKTLPDNVANNLIKNKNI